MYTLNKCVGTATLLVPKTWYFTNFFGGLGRNFLSGLVGVSLAVFTTSLLSALPVFLSPESDNSTGTVGNGWLLTLVRGNCFSIIVSFAAFRTLESSGFTIWFAELGWSDLLVWSVIDSCSGNQSGPKQKTCNLRIHWCKCFKSQTS